MARSADWTPHSTRSGDSAPATVASARAADSGSCVASVDPDAAVGAHRERALHDLVGLVVAGGDGDDLAAVGLAQGQRGLDRAGVPLVQGVVEEVGIDGAAVGRELEVVGHRADLLDAYEGLHQAAVCHRQAPGW